MVMIARRPYEREWKEMAHYGENMCTKCAYRHVQSCRLVVGEYFGYHGNGVCQNEPINQKNVSARVHMGSSAACAPAPDAPSWRAVGARSGCDLPCRECLLVHNGWCAKKTLPASTAAGGRRAAGGSPCGWDPACAGRHGLGLSCRMRSSRVP